MLISVREAYKYARAHIVGDGLAPLSPLDVEDFGEHPEKTPVCYCRTARTSFNTSLLLSKVLPRRLRLERWLLHGRRPS